MTTGELKAAAERLQIYFDALNRDYIENDHDDPLLRQHIDDGLNVLAALPDLDRLRRENEPTPVTAEWLKSECGFYGDDLITHRWITNSFRLYFVDRIATGVVMYTGGDMHYKTRGDVRRLCSVLGIELKETGE